MRVRLGDVFENQITGEWGNECAENEIGTKVLRTTNFTSAGIINYKDVVVRSIDKEKIAKKRLIYGDIILEKSGGTEKTPVGRVVFCDESIEKDVYLCNNFTQAMRVNSTMAVPRYVFFFMWNLHCTGKTDLLQNKTTGIRNLQVKSYLNENFPLPPLDEQRKIASILDKVSDLISKRRKQLDKLDELVKARFVEMFGDPLSNSKGWSTKLLGELCDISRGGSPRPINRYLGGTVPWIKIGDATSGDDIYLHSTKEYIIEEGVRRSRLIKAGSLIFANCGVSLGFARIITFDGCIHDGWLSLENINEALDKVFLLKSLNSCTDYFRRLAPEGTQPNLNTGIMKTYVQILPPFSLQQDFATFVQQVDNSKSAIKKSLEKLELLKKALMQEYFG